jgi:DNA-binding transcriptional ArsR family regulator
VPVLDLTAVFGALADPSRRRVVATLAREPAGTERPCGSFDLPVHKATRTHHFKVLREAGLVSQRDHGNGSAVTLLRDDIEATVPGLLAALVAEG